MYIIGNREDPNLFWSNDLGWVDPYSADQFNDDEKSRLNLPIGGYWLPLWSVDVIQFARFIAECESAGVLTSDSLASVAESMDLELSDLGQLVDRAQNVWDEYKNKLLHPRDS